MTSGSMKINNQIWIIKPDPAGSIATIMLYMEMPWGIIGKIMEMLFVGRMIKKHVKDALINLRKIAEV